MLRLAVVSALLALACGGPALAQADMSSDPTAVPAGAYTLDKGRSSVTMKVSHLGLSYYTLRFDGVSGSYGYDPAHPEATKLDVSIDPASIDTGDPAFNREIASEFFEAAKYPTLRFVSTGVRSGGEDHGTVAGALTFHGVTKPVTLDVIYNGAGKGQNQEQRMGFSASTTLRRSDFGVTKDLPLVGDDVSVSIETEFSR